MKLFTLLTLFFSTLSYGQTLKSSLEFLSSDALEGRRAGSIGNKVAEDYLEKELKSMGLDPLGQSYKQEFTIFTKMIKNGANSFSAKDLTAQKFEPLSYSLSNDIKSADLVFAGFGISIPANDTKLKYDDYEGVDVKDKIVVIFTGDPGIGNKKSLFRDPDYINYRSIFYKLKNAIAHGAVGLVIVQDPLSIEDYPNESDPFFNAREGGGQRFSIVAGYITNKFFDSLLKAQGMNPDSLSLQKTLAKNQKPQSFSMGIKSKLSVHLKKETGRVSNIVAVARGSDPALKEVIVLGAHMDHLGFGGDSSMDSTQTGKIHNGADDNASGTALVLSMAQKIKTMNLKRTYIISFFNAEEIGLVGSTHFVDMWAAHVAEYGKITAMLNYDMVGRYQKDLSVMAMGSSTQWQNLIQNIQTPKNFVLSLKKDALGSSDHAPFLRAKIPSLFFTTGAHEDYHRSSDTSEKIDFKRMESLEIVSLKLLKKIDSSKSLVFNPAYADEDTSGGSRGYGAHLGCVPEFGQSDEILGVKCIDTSKDSPAQKAGILAGDILVQIGDIEVKSIYDLAFALKYYRAGDEVELAWMRSHTLMKQTVTLSKSKPRH